MLYENPQEQRPGSGYQLGKVYIIGSAKYRPGQFKLGLSNDESKRIKSGKTWLEDAQVLHEQSFLNIRATEKAMHRHFAAHRIGDSEWFEVELGEARQQLDRFHAEEAAARARLQQLMREAIELGLVHAELPNAPNTALEALWKWRPSKTSASVGEMFGMVNGASVESFEAATVLRKAGFVLCLSEQVALFDLSEKSNLVRFLDREVGKGRWEQQLRLLAGVTMQGEGVLLSAWRECTLQPPETVDYVVTRGGNPRFANCSVQPGATAALAW